jgi:hypothetical protein
LASSGAAWSDHGLRAPDERLQIEKVEAMAIQKMMKAAIVERFGAPLVVREVPVPTPGPGQALVEISATGVCHTDHRGNSDRHRSAQEGIPITFGNGTTETLHMTTRAAAESEASLQGEEPTRIIVYYSDESGRKVAHYFKKGS